VKISVVDDDSVLRMIIVDQLNDPRDVISEFTDGKSLLAEMDVAPDLILLDIEMPEMDGIAVCKALRDAGQDQIQVIFVSSHDDLETRLAAYAAGARDFIVKPFEPEEVTAKVNVVRDYLKRKAESSSNFEYAQHVAFTAMSSLGEMGVIMQFLRRSFNCLDADGIASAMLEALTQYGLDSLIELRTGDIRQSYAASGECTPMQRSILTHTQSLERIFRFRSHLAINYPNVTLVILNLPADEELVGRLRDHLAVLAEGASARIQSLEIERLHASRGDGIAQVLADLTQTLHEIEQTQATSRLTATEVDTHYLQDMTSAFARLGLTDSQENILTDLAQRTRMELAKLREVDGSASDRLRSIRKHLLTLVGAGAPL